MEVSDEISVTFSTGGRLCDSCKRRKRDRGECSLDSASDFERDVTHPPLPPEQYVRLKFRIKNEVWSN